MRIVTEEGEGCIIVVMDNEGRGEDISCHRQIVNVAVMMRLGVVGEEAVAQPESVVSELLVPTRCRGNSEGMN